MSKEFRVSDLFRKQGEAKAKAELGADYFYNNRSVYSKNFTNTRTYRNIANSFTQIIRDKDVKEARLVNVDTKASYKFNIEYNNRNEVFEFEGKRVGYGEITKVEETIENYNHLRKIGYSNFYKLQKKNEHGLETVLCVLAISKK